MKRLTGIYVLDSHSASLIYGPPERLAIAEMVHIDEQIYSPAEALASDRLPACDVILSGWGGPKLDDIFLAAAPNLTALFYGAGSLAGIVTPAAWQRKIVMTSAYAANARPVAEYTLAMVLLSLKNVFRRAADVRRANAYPPGAPAAAGAYGATVALVSLSMIGRTVLELLKPFDVHAIAYDPIATAAEAAALGVELVSLDDCFRRADVVSLHAPLLSETVGLITGAHIDSMKPNATFINTARGAIVRENEMIDVLTRRPDLQAILDVTHPEPPAAGSPLYTLPNVLLTPHVAGSQDTECRRMGRAMVDELTRFLAGEPLKWAVSADSIRFSSHRPPQG